MPPGSTRLDFWRGAMAMASLDDLWYIAIYRQQLGIDAICRIRDRRSSVIKVKLAMLLFHVSGNRLFTKFNG